MKKIFIGIGIYCLSLTNAVGQLKYSPSNNLSTEEKTGFRSLKIDEVNIVSAYYQQDGNHAAVTGGTGSEFLKDYSNNLTLKMSFNDKKLRVNSVTIDASVDYYSSASQDMIDSRTLSSASLTDTHFYPSISWSRKNEDTHNTVGASFAYSTEWDYKSYGGSLSFAKSTPNNNTELNMRLGLFLDTYMCVLPYELRPAGYPSGAEGDQKGISYKPRNSYSYAIGVSQIVNKRLHALLTFEPTYQEGFLSTPFNRVYFTNGSETVEKLPGSKLKLPVSLRTSYFLGDRFIIRAFYRYYADTWGMKANTVSLELPIKINSFFSITPHYRFSAQTASKYFEAYGMNSAAAQYYTSDYDNSKFNSSFYGAGVRVAPPGGIFGNKWWNSAELRYGHYSRSNGLVANNITLTTKLK